MTTRQAFETEARKHGFILDRLDKSGEYVQLVTEQAWSIWQAAKATRPAWHDAPTEPGIWLCDEGGPDCYTWTAHNIVLLNDPALKDDECRWYGPIPQDKKGGAP